MMRRQYSWLLAPYLLVTAVVVLCLGVIGDDGGPALAQPADQSFITERSSFDSTNDGTVVHREVTYAGAIAQRLSSAGVGELKRRVSVTNGSAGDVSVSDQDEGLRLSVTYSLPGQTSAARNDDVIRGVIALADPVVTKEDLSGTSSLEVDRRIDGRVDGGSGTSPFFHRWSGGQAEGHEKLLRPSGDRFIYQVVGHAGSDADSSLSLLNRGTLSFSYDPAYSLGLWAWLAVLLVGVTIVSSFLIAIPVTRVDIRGALSREVNARGLAFGYVVAGLLIILIGQIAVLTPERFFTYVQEAAFSLPASSHTFIFPHATFSAVVSILGLILVVSGAIAFWGKRPNLYPAAGVSLLLYLFLLGSWLHWLTGPEVFTAQRPLALVAYVPLLLTCAFALRDSLAAARKSQLPERTT